MHSALVPAVRRLVLAGIPPGFPWGGRSSRTVTQ